MATDPSEADAEEADTEVSPEGVEVADEAAEEPPPESVDWPVARFSRVQFDDEWFGDPEALSEFAAPAAVGDSASPEQNVASSSPYDTVFLYSYGYAVNTNTLPSIAGYVTYWQSYLSTYYNPGGRWIPPNYADLLHVGSATNSFRCYGVSTANDLAGVWGTQACVALNGASPVWLLPTLSTNLSSEALAIARNGGKIVGWSKNAASVTRPTLWTGSGANWTANDLGDLETGKAGYAYSVNNNGVAVGKGQVGVNWRAFRKDGGLMTALALPPSLDTFIPAKSTANGVDEAGNAVGATDAVIIRKVGTNIQTRAAIWWIGTNEPTVLGTIFPEGADAYTNPPGRSEALAISTAGLKSTVVGTGWITPTGYPRAWLLSAEKTHPDKDPLLSHMINLSDPHLTYIEECSPSGSCWVLSTAEDVNDQGWIVGNGTRNGNIRGYVLVPQSAVGQ
ncbi:MAG: hypothetical protein M5U12_11500 [Verrucomicrobia bacterium]|nr:hypothetical protein [Verrucomicrobiota bacterium]